MKLDRNINPDGLGKYALLNLRKIEGLKNGGCHPFENVAEPIASALKLLEEKGILQWATKGTEDEFFLIRLKDKYAGDALGAYAYAATQDDPEYGSEVAEIAGRAGLNSPWCKAPD